MIKQKSDFILTRLFNHGTIEFTILAEVALGERCPNSEQSSAYILNSPLGHIYTNACPDGLHCVKLYGDTSYDDIDWDTKVDFIRASALLPSNAHAKQLKKWLQMYFSNPIECRDIDISFCGLEQYGEFNSAVWMTIYKNCPPGELMSYRELGEQSGYGAGASKVVGYAINKNPYMLVVGDHRVIKASGEIWCENESQRNKLRRLLVKYEIKFTSDTFEDALLKVKERNERTKGTRQRSKTASGSARKKVKAEPEETKSSKTKKSGSSRAKAPAKKSGSKPKTRGRKKRDQSSEEEESEDETYSEESD